MKSGQNCRIPFQKKTFINFRWTRFARIWKDVYEIFSNQNNQRPPRSLNDFQMKHRVSVDSPRIFRADVLQKTISSLVFIRIRRFRCHRLIIVVLFTCGFHAGSDIMVQQHSKRSAEHRPACACGYWSNGDGVYPMVKFTVSPRLQEKRVNRGR